MMDIVLLRIDAGIEANMDTDLLMVLENVIAPTLPNSFVRKPRLL
jgi:hypothetical protein